jgi:hypothetical protein
MPQRVFQPFCGISYVPCDRFGPGTNGRKGKMP